MQKIYANVIVDISHESLDKTFQYKIPGELQEKVQVGMAVEIPFGRSNRFIKGYILEITDTAEFDLELMKPISKILEQETQIECMLIELADWIKENYGSTMIQALKTVIPIKQKIKPKQNRYVKLLLGKEEAKIKLEEYQRKHQTARERLLRGLMETEVMDYQMLTGKLHISAAVIKALEEQSVLIVQSKQVYRNPINLKEVKEKQIQLSEEQQYAVNGMIQDYKEGIRKTYLLHGITGSGKTEVYMELINYIIQNGMQVIMLIPEIALTYQTVLRFYARFGNRVSIMNSKMSQGERFDQFERAKNGEIDIMIGPRSALFTPFAKLGLIIIDEEHEGSYKSETVPKYHARETAQKRAQMNGASLLLGSATPSIEAYYRALNGTYGFYRLNQRNNESKLPVVYTVDLREELKAGNRSVLSRKLKDLIEDRLKKKQQIILFLNRRGYAGFISCRACGYVMKCPHCDVALSAHNNSKLVCHYCGYEEAETKKCPKCASPYIGAFRAGTQQIEELVKREYPRADVLRMDMDTTKQKGGHEKILAAFANQEADILIGTQMIVKGHDFPNVTLVGVLAADLSLYANDYHAGERTFQLLTQAAGRAGRGREEGEVVIQTYSPEHYSIQSSAAQNYEEFYRQEIAYRSMMGYPPVSNLLAVLILGREEEAAGELGERMKKAIQNTGLDVQVIGVAAASIGKINDIYRKVLYFKHEQYAILTKVKDILEDMLEKFKRNEFEKYSNTMVQFDFNPMNTY